MPDDRFPMHSADADRDLVAALRALPLASPKRSVYADLEHALVATRPSPLRAGRTRGAWIALAACLVAAIAGVRLFHPAADMATTDAVPSPDTLALIAQSQRLDDMLATLDARSVPIDAGTAMASAELEDLIGLTDLQLSVAERPEESLALWQQRVLLMNELAEVRRTGRSRIAADNADMMPAAYRLN